jgi:divalent metal cation (Fe/Co/Zn/Cd) transporter
LSASSTDLLGDLLTSVASTAVLIVSIYAQLNWLDAVASLVLGIFILHNGLEIFRENSLNLVEYFDPKLEEQYKNTIDSISDIQNVTFLKAEMTSNIIILDVIVTVDGTLSVTETAKISEKINNIMFSTYNIALTKIIFMPYNI